MKNLGDPIFWFIAFGVLGLATAVLLVRDLVRRTQWNASKSKQHFDKEMRAYDERISVIGSFLVRFVVGLGCGAGALIEQSSKRWILFAFFLYCVFSGCRDLKEYLRLRSKQTQRLP